MLGLSLRVGLAFVPFVPFAPFLQFVAFAPFAPFLQFVAFATLAASTASTAPAAAQFGSHYTGAPIHYGTGPTADPVARLVREIAGGDAKLRQTDKAGYLQALLDALAVPVSSQTLVFSKTSFQHALISPRNPRAVYFGDDVYVGHVPGARYLEITAMDPRQGPIFYVLDQRAAEPTFTRKSQECLTCHGGSHTAGWPGNLVRSVHTTAAGHVATNAGSFVTTQDSPFAQRWGGWYVTGTHGAMRHMGNVHVSAGDPTGTLDMDAGANVRELRNRVGAGRHLSPHSDIVALLVLEHQTEMHNLLARAGYRVRSALHRDADTNRALGRPAGERSAATEREIRDAAQQVVEFLLFKNEIRLPSPVRGTSKFATEFAAQGPRDRRGRSLRALDLQARLFRFPCSYLIYAPAFDALPPPVLDRVYARLWRVLGGRLSRRAWGLDRAQRQAILEILLETKPGLPETWRHIEVR